MPYSMRLEFGSWLQRFAFVNSGYEEKISRLLAALWETNPERGAIYDVGANIGLIAIPTCLLLDVSGSDNPDILAFEPLAENVTVLKENILANGLAKRIRVFGVALGDKNGWARLESERTSSKQIGSGTANIVPAESKAEALREIPVRSLDSLRRDGRLDVPCRVLKVDTDGFDLNVLLGARRLLAADRPFVFGEFDVKSLAWHRQDLAQVEEFASEMDYTVLWPVHSGSTRFQVERPAGFEQDLLLVPRESMPLVGWCVDLSRRRPARSIASAGRG